MFLLLKKINISMCTLYFFLFNLLKNTEIIIFFSNFGNPTHNRAFFLISHLNNIQIYREIRYPFLYHFVQKPLQLRTLRHIKITEKNLFCEQQKLFYIKSHRFCSESSIRYIRPKFSLNFEQKIFYWYFLSSRISSSVSLITNCVVASKFLESFNREKKNCWTFKNSKDELMLFWTIHYT